MGESSRRKPWALPVALAIVCALLVWLLSPGRVPEPTAAPAQSASPPPIATFAPPKAVVPGVGTVTKMGPDGHPIRGVPNAPPPVELPGDTQKLTEEFVPGTTEWEQVPLLENTPLVIRVLPKRYNVVVPNPMVVFIEIVDVTKKTTVKPERAYARFRPADAKADDAWTEVQAVDDGSGEDEKAGDGRYTATWAPSSGEASRWYGHVFVEGVVETAKAGVRRVPHTLIYTRGPRAKMTGKWRDEIKDGHLVIEGECEVEESGSFSLMGQLVGPGREPIALTRTYPVLKLDKGTTWIALRVWGKVIRDTGLDGPYELRNVMLERVMNEKGDYDPSNTIALAHTTKAYRFGDFSDAKWVDPGPSLPYVGPDSPSQKNNPPPMFKESDRPSLNAQPKASVTKPEPDPNVK